MTNIKKETKPPIKTRAPGKLSRSGMFDRVKLPATPHPIEEIITGARLDDPPTTHHPPPTTQPTSDPYSIAPERDFARVPNSIARVAIPSGLFRGESKKLYDALYQRTRGAVVPRRSIRATQAELMDWASISRNTLKSHLKHLGKVRLLKVHYVRGDNTGAEYEIFVPEELTQSMVQPPTTHPPPTTQNLGPPTTQNLVGGGWGQVVEDSSTYGNRKTSFNTIEKIDDDEAHARLRRAMKEITGKDVSATAFDELDELLTAEFKIAASRTTVSSGPAFLTEHLRRRLWKKDKKQIEIEGQGAPLESNPQIDASKCPDCGGSGFYYPTGFEAGVAKCKHEKLINLTDPTHLAD